MALGEFTNQCSSDTQIFNNDLAIFLNIVEGYSELASVQLSPLTVIMVKQWKPWILIIELVYSHSGSYSDSYSRFMDQIFQSLHKYYLYFVYYLYTFSDVLYFS